MGSRTESKATGTGDRWSGLLERAGRFRGHFDSACDNDNWVSPTLMPKGQGEGRACALVQVEGRPLPSPTAASRQNTDCLGWTPTAWDGLVWAVQSFVSTRLSLVLHVAQLCSRNPRAVGRRLSHRGHPTCSFDFTMSQVLSSSTSSITFETIFAAALKTYNKQTKKDIVSHPLATQIQSCDSSSAILAVLRTQVQIFDQSQSADEKLTKWLDPTVNVLFAFSTTLGNGVGVVITRR